MKDSSNTTDAPCFTNFALQEYLMGRLGDEVREELNQHLDTCPQCTACLKLMNTETQLLRAALKHNSGEPEDQKLDSETLARYLDDSLGDVEREECERLLVSSPKLLASLLQLQHELSALRVLDPQAFTPSETPEGRILRMPKRRVVPQNISELGSTDSEAAQA